MLVFLSDVHLTDGPPETAIDPRAFKKFCDLLVNIIGDPSKTNIHQVEIVLLGDIFDVIRSDFWLRKENQIPNPIRPWSAPNDEDSANCNRQMYTEKIVKRIIDNPRNQEAVRYLKDFEQWCAAHLGLINFTVSYLIGNHDWLINLYPAARQAVADFLGLTPPDYYVNNEFNECRPFDLDDYPVFARHGDYYDPFNFEGDRKASSLGDAIVIDLLNKFPEAVKNSPLGTTTGLYDQLREIDNVRPLWEIPAWIQGLCMRYSGITNQMHDIWNGLVDDFCALNFVKQHQHWDLKAALRLSEDFSFDRLRQIVESWIARKLWSDSDDYRGFAYKEWAMQQAKARYVVYGHTHQAEQVPLDLMPPTASGVTEALYFNTGTWRKVFEHTVFDPDRCEFIGWYVLTFLVFYLAAEKEPDRNYEVWSASLGYGS
jgi:UDP-2,3-diacylglucosamine pyrophosphatase LpxH